MQNNNKELVNNKQFILIHDQIFDIFFIYINFYLFIIIIILYKLFYYKKWQNINKKFLFMNQMVKTIILEKQEKNQNKVKCLELNMFIKMVKDN